MLLAGAALLGVVGIVLLAERLAGYRGLVDHLRTARPGWLLAGVAAETASFAGFIAVVRGSFGPDLGARTATRLVLASLGAARTIAAGGPAGIAVFFWAARKLGHDRDDAAVRVGALYVLLFGVFGCAAWLCALAAVATGGSPGLTELAAPWLLGVPVAAVAAARVRGPQGGVRGLGAPGRWLARALRDAQAAVELVRAVAAHPRRHAGTLAGALVYWLGDAACLWTALRAFDVSAPLPAFGVAYATAYLVTLLPLPVNGVGIVEATTTLALRAAGVPVAAALLAALAYRAIAFWLPTLPGIAAFATLARLGPRFERQAARR